MAMKYFLSTLEELGDAQSALAEHYAPRTDGTAGFQLVAALPEGYSVENIAGLKATLSKATGEAQTARHELASMRAVLGDVTIDDAIGAHNRMAELGDDADIDARVKAGIETRETQLVRKHKQEMENASTSASAIRTQLETLMVRDAASSAIRDASGNPDLLIPIVEKQVKMREGSDGQLVVEVQDEYGNPAIADAQGNPQTIAGLVAELKSSDRYSQAFDSSGARGAGSKPNQTTQRGVIKTTETKQQGSILMIDPNDQEAINANAEKIANGEAEVAAGDLSA